MQIFLPWPDYAWSVQFIDNQRLNKQVTEGFQLLRTNLGMSKGHPRHPSKVMYEQHLESMLAYITAAEAELERRGTVNVAAANSVDSVAQWQWGAGVGDLPERFDHEELKVPLGYHPRHPAELARLNVDAQPWGVGHPALHLSHQLNLARKRPDIYADLFDLRAHATAWYKVNWHAAPEDHVPDGYGPTDYFPLVHYWGSPTNPYVDVDVEPYMWPITGPDGSQWFQVGTATDRPNFAHLFDQEPKRGALYVTPDEALARLQRDHPRILARYTARVAERNLAAEAEVAAHPLMRSTRQTWPQDLT